MQFIEMTGKTLAAIINDGELREDDLHQAGVEDHTLVRVNQQGDLEVRRRDRWEIIGRLLGNYEERVRRKTGMDWASSWLPSRELFPMIGADESAAERIAVWAKGARVVKAFNTASARTMQDPIYAGCKATMFFRGDDVEARWRKNNAR